VARPERARRRCRRRREPGRAPIRGAFLESGGWRRIVACQLHDHCTRRKTSVSATPTQPTTTRRGLAESCAATGSTLRPARVKTRFAPSSRRRSDFPCKMRASADRACSGPDSPCPSSRRHPEHRQQVAVSKRSTSYMLAPRTPGGQNHSDGHSQLPKIAGGVKLSNWRCHRQTTRGSNPNRRA
jgi:hypothetical protein